jgi:methionine-rich copper-binding protein CopC
MKLLAMVGLALAAAALLLSLSSSADAQPKVTLMFPEDGNVLVGPPPIIHMCFADPVNVKDLDKGGDFRFNVLTPEGLGLGLRIVFQPDGFGVDVHAGYPVEPPEGEWTFQWRVTEPDTLEPSSGTVKFTVAADGDPVPEDEPEACTGEGTPTASGTQVSPPDNGRSSDDDDDGLSTVVIIIIAMAAAAGAGVIGLVLYRFRSRSGPQP